MEQKEFKLTFLNNESASQGEAMICDWRTGICGPVDETDSGKLVGKGREEEAAKDGNQ